MMRLELSPTRLVLLVQHRGDYPKLMPANALPAIVRSACKTLLLEDGSLSRKISREQWLRWRGKLRRIVRLSYRRAHRDIGVVTGPVTVELEDP